MLLAGWGKNSKEISYIGVMKCQNCKNYSHFSLYEVANKVTVYFVPVAKFNSKYIVACSVCDCGWEIDQQTKTELLKDGVDSPSKELHVKLWEEIEREFHIKISESNNQNVSLENIVDEIVLKLKEKYTERHVEKVMHSFLLFLADSDRPR